MVSEETTKATLSNGVAIVMARQKRSSNVLATRAGNGMGPVLVSAEEDEA